MRGNNFLEFYIHPALVIEGYVFFERPAWGAFLFGLPNQHSNQLATVIGNTKTERLMSVITKKESFSETEFLNTEHVAVRLGVSAWTLSRWRVQGTGPAWRRIGPKRVVYSATDVNAFLSKASA